MIKRIAVVYGVLFFNLISYAGEELLANGGFEQFLAPEEWTFITDGEDWNGQLFVSTTSHIEIDAESPAAGKSCLKVWSIGPAALAGRMLPYHGGKLVMTGKICSNDLLPGPRFPEGGGIQLVGFDADGKVVEHHDVKLISGTHEWQNFSAEVKFGGEVKFVQVWIRLFQHARGAFMVDELSLTEVI